MTFSAVSNAVRRANRLMSGKKRLNEISLTLVDRRKSVLRRYDFGSGGILNFKPTRVVYAVLDSYIQRYFTTIIIS